MRKRFNALSHVSAKVGAATVCGGARALRRDGGGGDECDLCKGRGQSDDASLHRRNSCSMCRIGYTQICLVQNTVYGSSANSGHQGYLLCPASICVEMPESVSFEEGVAVVCGTRAAFHAMKRLGISGVDTLAVFG